MNSMRVVALKPFNHPKFFHNGIFDVSKEERSRIFVTLRDFLWKRGYQLITIDMPQAARAQAVVALDVPYPWDLPSWRYILRHIRHTIVFHWEPPIINPFNYMWPIHFLFKTIYTCNDSLVNGKKYKKFYYPKTDTGFVKQKIPFSKKKLLTMVASNLAVFFPFQLLSGSQELYSFRQNIVQFFDRYASGEFDLYGKGWNKPRRFSIRDTLLGFRRYVSYRGVCKNQYEVLSRYRFALCLENVDLPGYLCEKMFDCMKAGSVPIYLGASNIGELVPKECFIDLRDFSLPRRLASLRSGQAGEFNDLLTFLRSMDEPRYERYLACIKKFLAARATQRWFEYGFAELVLVALHEAEHSSYHR